MSDTNTAEGGKFCSLFNFYVTLQKLGFCEISSLFILRQTNQFVCNLLLLAVKAAGIYNVLLLRLLQADNRFHRLLQVTFITTMVNLTGNQMDIKKSNYK